MNTNNPVEDNDDKSDSDEKSGENIFSHIGLSKLKREYYLYKLFSQNKVIILINIKNQVWNMMKE